MRRRQAPIVTVTMILFLVFLATPLMAAEKVVEFNVPGCNT
jgi:hypothetical protein